MKFCIHDFSLHETFISYINAVKSNKLSPQCIHSIESIVKKYTNEYSKYLNKYESGIFKN